MKKITILVLILSLFCFSKSTTGTYDLFFGDSLMFGYPQYTGGLVGTQTWPNWYCDTVGKTIDNRAMGGYAITPGYSTYGTFLMSAFPSYDSKYDKIFIGYGINDFFFGAPVASYASSEGLKVDSIVALGYSASQIVLVWTWFWNTGINTYGDSIQTVWRTALRNVAIAKHTQYLDFSAPCIAKNLDSVTYVVNPAHVTLTGANLFAYLAEHNIETPTSSGTITIYGRRFKVH